MAATRPGVPPASEYWLLCGLVSSSTGGEEASAEEVLCCAVRVGVRRTPGAPDAPPARHAHARAVAEVERASRSPPPKSGQPGEGRRERRSRIGSTTARSRVVAPSAAPQLSVSLTLALSGRARAYVRARVWTGCAPAHRSLSSPSRRTRSTTPGCLASASTSFHTPLAPFAASSRAARCEKAGSGGTAGDAAGGVARSPVKGPDIARRVQVAVFVAAFLRRRAALR